MSEEDKAPSKKAATKKSEDSSTGNTVDSGAEGAGSATSETAESQHSHGSPVPRALVLSRHEGMMHERSAKGFSFGEITAAGLTFTIAKGLSLPLDLRRRSTLEENIAKLKEWYKPTPKKPARQPKEGETREQKGKKSKGAKRKPSKAKKSTGKSTASKRKTSKATKDTDAKEEEQE